jgi:hypothetical protein
MVDALDECNSDLSQLLDLIARNDSEPSSKVKWLVTSRAMPEIEQRLRPDGLGLKAVLDLNSSHISHAVNAFIDVKVSELAKQRNYDNELQKEIKGYLYEKANGTFLWVALVCRELQEVPLWETWSVLQNLPPGLAPLYQRMVAQILEMADAGTVELCKRTLSSVMLTHRPIHLKELVVIAGLPEELPDDLQSLNKLVQFCGSFLTIQEDMVYFIHPSAKHYFATENDLEIFPLGQEEEHLKIASRSLQIMSDTLRKDICDLRIPGVLLKGLGGINQDPLAHIQYACCYWVDHLSQAGGLHLQTSLLDGGIVHEFLQKHLLHWLEVLSLTGKMSEGVLAITSLESLILVSYIIVHWGILANNNQGR